jgi:Kef-type K+ transport system membrane component KefB
VDVILLLPLFFVFTGLKTEIDLSMIRIYGKLRSHNLGCRVGKFLGSALAAKFVGQNWKTA